jgi:hypothetical protein
LENEDENQRNNLIKGRESVVVVALGIGIGGREEVNQRQHRAAAAAALDDGTRVFIFHVQLSAFCLFVCLFALTLLFLTVA